MKTNLSYNCLGECSKWDIYLFLYGQPSEQNTYADIEAAYRCLVERYGAKEEDVILYGQSVGSGPTLDLATRLPRLRAVVLHSPIMSGLRVMYPVKRTYWFDIYKVFNLYRLLSLDDLVQFSHNIWSECMLMRVWPIHGAEHWQNTLGQLSCSGDSCEYLFFFKLYALFP